MKSIYAHITSIHHKKGNLGDKMGFLIASYILGNENYRRLGIREKSKIDANTFGIVGSLIAAMTESEGVVMGGGLINSNKREYSDKLKILAVRGFLTKALIIRDKGDDPDVISDPGLLISRIFTMQQKPNKKPLGFIVHHVDREAFAENFPEYNDLIVDNYEEPEIFIEQLSNYEVIASTSLHGCVFCHAFGIPVAPFVLTDNVFGGNFKFLDYYSSLGIDIGPRKTISKQFDENIKLINSTPQPNKKLVQDIQDRQYSLIKNKLLQNKTLIITETIFCDNENREDVLNKYLGYFGETLRSYSECIIDERFDHLYLIYISSDKLAQKKVIENLINKIEWKNTIIKLVVYDHPDEGYPSNPALHIDTLINPNKGPGLRDALFLKASVSPFLNNYQTVIRTSIDDDDLIHKSHLLNIVDLADDATKMDCGNVIGIGMVNLFLVYKGEVGYETQAVTLSRAINGNKFWVFKGGVDCSSYSPWMVPDIIDDEVARNFKRKLNADLFLVNNENLGLFYMRRGKNLSNFRKDHFVSSIHDSFSISCITGITEVNNSYTWVCGLLH